MQGKLYVVATPIGNLADMTPRAIETLQQVDLIAAEDTRHTGPLLKHFNISTHCIAYHDHNEKSQTEQLIAKMLSGELIALVSDAGTPLISDPGYSLVHAAIENNIQVSAIPGSCAFVTALAASGLPTDRFYFSGFLAAQGTAREKQLQNLEAMTCTLIFYESKHRILDSLQSMANVFGEERYCVVGRELTKKFEVFYYGDVAEVIQKIEADTDAQKGEFVVLLQGNNKNNDVEILPETKRILAILSAELPPKTAAKLAAEITGIKKSRLYSLLLA